VSQVNFVWKNRISHFQEINLHCCHEHFLCCWNIENPYQMVYHRKESNIIHEHDLWNNLHILHNIFNKFKFTDLQVVLTHLYNHGYQNHKVLIYHSHQHAVHNLAPFFHKSELLTLDKYGALISRGSSGLSQRDPSLSNFIMLSLFLREIRAIGIT